MIEALIPIKIKMEDMKRKHRQSHNIPVYEETLEDKRIKAETLLETSQNVLFTLGELGREFPQIQEEMKMSLNKCGLKVPARPPTTVPRGHTTDSMTMSRGNTRSGTASSIRT